jgi:hypothetical protein
MIKINKCLLKERVDYIKFVDNDRKLKKTNLTKLSQKLNLVFRLKMFKIQGV